MEEPRDRLQREARKRCPPHPCKADYPNLIVPLFAPAAAAAHIENMSRGSPPAAAATPIENMSQGSTSTGIRIKDHR